MKVYLLQQKDSLHLAYDENIGKVVVAKTAKKAREIANIDVRDEGKIWTDTKLISCHKVALDKEHEVIANFVAG